jgi:endogenous inhibitor of DNA gyrase (YacG/DUF329 family)
MPRSDSKPKTAPVVNCPICGKGAPYGPENPYRPFCSERCKLIDLGQWATESYRIPEGEGKPAEDGE